MATDSNDIAAKLIAQLSGRRTTKIVRFLLNVLASTPVFGGVFSATAAAWSEREQTDFNQLVVLLLEITDEKVDELQSDLVSISNRSHLVAGHVTFETNGTICVVDALGISSLTDNGRLDFTINFSRPLASYVFNYYGNGPVVLQVKEQTPSRVRFIFEEPAPERVTVVFFEQQPNFASVAI